MLSSMTRTEAGGPAGLVVGSLDMVGPLGTPVFRRPPLILATRLPEYRGAGRRGQAGGPWTISAGDRRMHIAWATRKCLCRSEFSEPIAIASEPRQGGGMSQQANANKTIEHLLDKGIRKLERRLDSDVLAYAGGIEDGVDDGFRDAVEARKDK